MKTTPGRNAPCTCGSGRKFKKCCGSLPAQAAREAEAAKARRAARQERSGSGRATMALLLAGAAMGMP